MAFGSSKDYKKLPNEKDILECVTDAMIFDHYLGGLPTKPINSPLRNEVKPSFSLFFSEQHDKILFKDFSTSDTGDAFVFVMRLFKLSRRVEAFNKIASDMGLTQFETNSSIATFPMASTNTGAFKMKRLAPKRLDLRVRLRDWTVRDRKFWNGKYGLEKGQLEYCDIYPISHYFINGYCKAAKEKAYAYIEEKDGIQTFKIYQPDAEPHEKWFNNNDFSTWELWRQLPRKGKRLIITSSRKDAVVIKSLFPSNQITSCSLQSEGVMPKQSVIDELKSRFNEVYVLYDNDSDKDRNRGRESGMKLSAEFGLKQIEIPTPFQIKDTSDFMEKHGRISTRIMLYRLLGVDKT